MIARRHHGWFHIGLRRRLDRRLGDSFDRLGLGRRGLRGNLRRRLGWLLGDSFDRRQRHGLRGEHRRRVIGRHEDLRLVRRQNDDQSRAAGHDLLLVGHQHARHIGLEAHLLDRSLHVLELVQDRLAERLGPVELRVHAGENIGIVQQADDARVPVRIRLQLGLLGQLAEEAVGRDDLDREGRALQDQDQQRIRIERDRSDQNVELLRSEKIRLRRDFPGCWLLGRRYRLLRCGLGGDLPGGWLLGRCCRLLCCGPARRDGWGRLLPARFDVRVGDCNKQCPSSHRPAPGSKAFPPPCHRCPLCGQNLISLRYAISERAARLRSSRSSTKVPRIRLLHADINYHLAASGPVSGVGELSASVPPEFHLELGQRVAQLGNPHRTLRVGRALPAPKGFNPYGVVLAHGTEALVRSRQALDRQLVLRKALDDVCRWPGHRLRPDLLGDEHTLDR